MAEADALSQIGRRLVLPLYPLQAIAAECDLTPGGEQRLRQAIIAAMIKSFIAGAGYGYGTAKKDEQR